MGLRPAEEDGVAVGAGAGDLRSTERRTAATDIFNYHRAQ